MTEAHQHQPHATHLLISIPFGPIAAPGGLVQAGPLWVAGYDVTESTGAAPATVQLLDGQDPNGIPAGAPTVLAANAARAVMFGGHLLTARTGVFVKVTAGSVSGVVYLATKS